MNGVLSFSDTCEQIMEVMEASHSRLSVHRHPQADVGYMYAASLLTGSQAFGTPKFCRLLDFQVTEHRLYVHKSWTHCALGLVGRLRLQDSGVRTLFWNRCDFDERRHVSVAALWLSMNTLNDVRLLLHHKHRSFGSYPPPPASLCLVPLALCSPPSTSLASCSSAAPADNSPCLGCFICCAFG